MRRSRVAALIGMCCVVALDARWFASWMRMVAVKALSSIAQMRTPVVRPSFDSSFMMILTYAMVVGDERLLDGEVDFNFRFGGFRVGGEAPALDGVLRGGGEKGVAGLDLGIGDGAVCLNLDEQYDFAADGHAEREFGIDGGGAVDDLSMGVSSMTR